MFQITPFGIIGLSIAISCFVLTIIILRLAQNNTHRIWAAFNTVVALWASGTYLAGISTFSEQALLYWKLAYIPCTFIAVVFYHFVCSFCHLKRTKMLIFAYTQGVFFLFFIFFSKLYINSSLYVFDSFYYHEATLSLSIWFAIWVVITYSAFYELLQFSKVAQGTEKTRVLYFFWGMLLGFSGGVTTLLPAYGFFIYPFWHATICIYVPIMTYAIFKHQLLGINVVIKKGVVYSLLIALISLIYLTIVLIFEKLLQGVLGYSSIFVSITTAFILGILFFPLRNRIQNFTDRHFFKGTQEQIAQENILLRQEVVKAEKLKTMSTFSSGIAHEIKNPLTAIKTFSEYLPERLNDKEFLEKFSRIVGKEVNRIDELVHQLLDYGKPAPITLQKTHFHDVINLSLDVFNAKYLNQKIEVIRNFHADPNLHIHTDPNKIQQALMNVIVNAIEAMPEGGILKVSSKLKAQKSKYPTVEITIQDTGGGIPKEDLKHIFEPFFSRKDQGSGLGLSIVQNIIENLKGKIRIKSKVGVGTEVVLELPA